MAKKQSVNIVEAHIEKVVLAGAVVVFLVVVGTWLLRPAGIEIDGRVVPAATAARNAAEMAEEVAKEMRRELNVNLQPYQPEAEKFIPQDLDAKLLAGNVPLSPPELAQGTSEPEERSYDIPEILNLKNVEIQLTHAQAWVLVPVDEQESTTRSPRMAAEEWQAKDVDFVTVEAVFPLDEMRKLFQQKFVTGAEEPLEQFAGPIVAMVDLQRQQLKPDGGWSAWESVPRMEVDQMAEREFSEQDIAKMPRANYEVLMDERQVAEIQLLLLQPQPYELLEDEWMPPTEKAELEAQEKEEERAAARADRSGTTAPGRRSSRPTTRTTRPRASSGGSASAAGGMDMGMSDMAMEMEMEARGGVAGEMMETGRQASVSPQSTPTTRTRRPGASRDRQISIEELEKEEITLWANDGAVQPGGKYRYQIRIGFFNPAARWSGTQEQNGQRVLWSAPAAADKIVSVPQRTIFFPKSAGKTAKNSISMEICRWQDGLWHKKRFRLTAGSAIGALTREKDADRDDRSTRRDDFDDQEQGVEIDYRTGATIIDIVPDVKHYRQKGREIICPDIIYRQSDGTIKRLPADRNCWPVALDDKYRRISKTLRAKNE